MTAAAALVELGSCWVLCFDSSGDLVCFSLCVEWGLDNDTADHRISPLMYGRRFRGLWFRYTVAGNGSKIRMMELVRRREWIRQWNPVSKGTKD
jgi:hypothetical protein